MGANAAARLLLLHLLEMMRANEAGILADADIEFLHEYRVAVRRTRSALSQIRKVFPPEEVEYFKRGFQELGRRTNDLRNLDVFLSTESGYRARLPNDMREDIAPLFDYLRSRRSGALASVVAGLESKPYSRFLNQWNLFLRRPVGENSPGNALVPIIKLARGRMDRQYHNILRDGANALAHPEDRHLHALRVECKKLRYLLEFFATLFPPQEVAPLLKRLKRLQNNLGALSDLGDQRDYLFSIAEILDVDGARARRSLVATGFLMEIIDREQRSTRAGFADIFKDFSSPACQKQFQKMIK
jgi:CHAD domain-containing protein